MTQPGAALAGRPPRRVLSWSMATRHDDYDEDRRLREMGIDPDGDPGEIRRQVAARYKALHANDDIPAKDKGPAEDAKRVVDMAELPR